MAQRDLGGVGGHDDVVGVARGGSKLWAGMHDEEDMVEVEELGGGELRVRSLGSPRV